MIIERFFPRTIDDLFTTLNAHCLDNTSVCVQAGHFLLYYDRTEDQLLPCVASELKGPRSKMLKQEVGWFPELTWDIGLRILRDIFPSAAKRDIITVVNDWQYVPEDINRFLFFDSHKKIFKAYKQKLKARDQINILKPSDLGFGGKTDPFFSETSLRNQYDRFIKRVILKNPEFFGAYVRETNLGVSCDLADALGRKSEIYCAGKQANCTHEIAELNRQILTVTGCDMFINIFPNVCRQFLELGTELAFRLSDLSKMKIINIGLSSSSVESINDLFSNSYGIIHVGLTQ